MRDDGKVKSVIGSGAYRITSLTPPLKIELERNDAWWSGAPTIEKISYLTAPKGDPCLDG